VTLIVLDWVSVFPAASVTLTVKDHDPVAVGVPDSLPVDDNLIPVGGLPVLNENVFVPVPPVVVNVNE